MTSMPSVEFQLQSELSNATNMLRSFVSEGDSKIPASLLGLAKGVAFMSVLKVGAGVSIRYGTGFVVARADDDTWTPPSAITLSGMGWGLQIGGEASELMLILTSDAAVEAFKSRGQMTVGAELGVAVGPVGKSVETDVTAGEKGAAHAFSYANSRGLFVGASLEACAIVQRHDVNKAFYGEVTTCSELLSGHYSIPRGAELMYEALDAVVVPSSVQKEDMPSYLAERKAARLQRYDEYLVQSAPATVANSTPVLVGVPVESTH
jgi:lipid-binding SYLF domain-containing protein